MANTFQLKRTGVNGRIPTTTDLALGELGINYFDGKLYLKKDNGTASIVEIGGPQSFSSITSKPTTLAGYGITDAASSTHTHGNITNAGAIGSTANLPIITTTSGVLTTGSFGTTANTFCQGNDSRLSDTRNTTNSITFNNGGSGAASGTTFNGSSAVTVSYNTIGAPKADGTGASGTWSINISGSASSAGTATNLSGGSVSATSGSFTSLNVTNPAISASAPSLGWPVYNAEADANSKVTYLQTSGNGSVSTAGYGATVSLVLGSYYDSRAVITTSESGGASPSDQGTGRGKDLLIKGGRSDNGVGYFGGRLYLSGGSGYSATGYNSNYGTVYIQPFGGIIVTGSGGNYMNGNQINAMYDTNANAELAFNYVGYQGGTAQYRDTAIYDGKNGLIARFIGSNGVLNFARANNTADGGGQIYLNGANGNRIDFNTNGVGAPTTTTRSNGTKIVLYPGLSASLVDYALGIEGGTLWSSVPSSAQQFKWYAGTTNIGILTGEGNLSISGSYSGGQALFNYNNGVTGATAPNYTQYNLQLYTSDNNVPCLSFHRAGHSATALYENDGQLYVNAWITRAQTGLLLSSGNYNSYAPTLTGTGASGTWGINITGTAATSTSATNANNSNSLNGLTEQQIFNNRGANHGTNQDFNSITSFGFSFMQNTTNGPGITSATQYYTLALGLGNDYAYSQYNMQLAIPRTPLGGNPYPAVRFRENGGWGSWSKLYAGYADSAGTTVNLSTTRTNWDSNGTISAVVGQLSWKNYGNSHTIFDASNSTSPSGTSINNTNAEVAWTGTYPTLMGWNGTNTFGVRVDSARVSNNVQASSDQAIYNQEDGTSQVWRGRILSKNSSANKSVFLGTYASIAGVFSHNNALTAWDDLYVNTVDGSGGGTVRMPSSVLINGNQAIHAGNYTSYAMSNVVDAWRASTDGYGRFYFANAGRTYYKSPGGHEFRRNATDLSTFVIDDSGNCSATGNITAYSDEKLKKDWLDISSDFISNLSKVKCGTFTRIDLELDDRQVGVSAQDLQKILPEAVMEDGNGILSVAYGNAALVSCVKIAQSIEAVLERINEIEKKLAPYTDLEQR